MKFFEQPLDRLLNFSAAKKLRASSLQQATTQDSNNENNENKNNNCNNLTSTPNNRKQKPRPKHKLQLFSSSPSPLVTQKQSFGSSPTLAMHEFINDSQALNSSNKQQTIFKQQPKHQLKTQQHNLNNNSMSSAELLSPIVRKLLAELYSRGPTTVGIFRKSPNAKQCKELRQKLEQNADDTQINTFPVTVVASVLKEWLRSLPDCLLMSRLYDQWIEVTKRIESLQDCGDITDTSNLSETAELSTAAKDCVDSVQALNARTHCINNACCKSNGNTAATINDCAHSKAAANCSQPATIKHFLTSRRALSCSAASLTCNNNTTTTTTTIATSLHQNISCDDNSSSQTLHQHHHYSSTNCQTTTTLSQHLNISTTSSNSFNNSNSKHKQRVVDDALECQQMVRKLIDSLDEANFVLLKSLICVLRHIASNCEHNKMSAQNLGVCVGQSLLTDQRLLASAATSKQKKHYASNSSSSNSCSNSCSKQRQQQQKLKRAQCLLSLTLSWSSLANRGDHERQSSTAASVACQLGAAQEIAKYVPVLVAYMIEKAPQLFGADVIDMFENSCINNVDDEKQQQRTTNTVANNETSDTQSTLNATYNNTKAATTTTTTTTATIYNRGIENNVDVVNDDSNNEFVDVENKFAKAPPKRPQIDCNANLIVASNANAANLHSAINSSSRQQLNPLPESQHLNRSRCNSTELCARHLAGHCPQLELLAKTPATNTVAAAVIVVPGAAAATQSPPPTLTQSATQVDTFNKFALKVQTYSNKQTNLRTAYLRNDALNFNSQSSKQLTGSVDVLDSATIINNHRVNNLPKTNITLCKEDDNDEYTTSIIIVNNNNNINNNNSNINNNLAKRDTKQQSTAADNYTHVDYCNYSQPSSVLSAHSPTLSNCTQSHNSSQVEISVTTSSNESSSSVASSSFSSLSPSSAYSTKSPSPQTPVSTQLSEPVSTMSLHRQTQMRSKSLSQQCSAQCQRSPITRQELLRRRHMMNRYSTILGIPDRYPKIPICFTTSNYGGEAIIYNPQVRKTIPYTLV